MSVRYESETREDASDLLSRFWSAAGIHEGFEGFSSPHGTPTVAAGGRFRGAAVFLEVWARDTTCLMRLTGSDDSLSDAQLQALLGDLEDLLTPAPTPHYDAAGLHPDGFTYSASHRIVEEEAGHMPIGEDLARAMGTNNAVIKDQRGHIVAGWNDFGVGVGVVNLTTRSLIVSKRAMPGDPDIVELTDGTQVDMLSIPGIRQMDFACDINAIDVSPDGSTIAVVEQFGFVALRDIATGARTALLKFSSFFGSERVKFSPCGTKILITRWDFTVIVDLITRTGTRIKQDGGTMSWQVVDGRLGLLTVGPKTEGGEVDVPRIFRHDLETGEHTEYPRIAVPHPDDPTKHRILSEPIVGPSGNVLMGISHDVSPEHSATHGTRTRVAVLDPTTGTIETFMPPFADPNGIVELIHDDWAWMGDPEPVEAPTIHPDLSLGTRELPEVESEASDFSLSRLLVVPFNTPLFITNQSDNMTRRAQ